MDDIITTSSAFATEPGWRFDDQAASLAFTVLTDEIVRIAFTPHGAPAHRTWSVLPESDARRAPNLALTQTAALVHIQTPAMTISIDQRTRRFFIQQADGVTICADARLFSTPEQQRWEMRLAPDAHILGGGERTGKLDRRGRKLTFWAQDAQPNYDEHTDAMYQPVAVLTQVQHGAVSGLFFDSNWWAQADIGYEDPDTLTYGTTGPDLVVYVCVGPTFRDTLRQYASITGYMPAPPRWSLGYQQSRWGYATADDVLAVAATLREQRIPCDAIHLDIDYMDGYRDFTWNHEHFPDPAGLVAELREQGLRVVTIIDPGVKVDPAYPVYQQGLDAGFFVRAADDTPFVGWVWPGQSVWADFAREDVQTWWGEQHRSLLDTGVAGIWIDMNEPTQADMWAPPEVHIPHGTSLPLDARHGTPAAPFSHAEFHNAYGLEMARATRDGLARLHPDERPFILTRAAIAGSQRYAVAWNGDTTSSWEHLRLAIPLNLGMGLSGFPITGCDLGGFWEDTTPELLVRFLQLGAFLPFCRNHSALDTRHQEPWSFGEPYTSACRAAIEWRYRLLPYLVTLAHEASVSGVPLMRPLCWLDPASSALLACDQEFLLGDALLVAPVVTEGVTEQIITLPPGEWFDVATDAAYTGPTAFTTPVSLLTTPLFARAGDIVPMTGITQYTSETPSSPLTLHVYLAHPGQRAQITLWDDDDHPEATRRGTFACHEIAAAWDDAIVTVSMQRVGGNMASRYPGIHVHLHVPPTYTQHLQAREIDEMNGKVFFSVRQLL